MVRRTKEEALATRNRILDAAERVFYDKGVSRTSLADIAQQAGVTRGAIYWHFANKGDVFTAMFDRVRMPLDELTTLPRDGIEHADPLGRLAEMLKQTLRMAASDPQRQRVLHILFMKCEFVEEMGPVKARYQTSIEDGIGKMESVLALAVRKGQLPTALDTQRAALLLFALISGCLRNTLLLSPELDFASHTGRFVDAAIDTLRTSPALHRTPPDDASHDARAAAHKSARHSG